MENFTPLTISLEGDGAFADWKDNSEGGTIDRVATLADGTFGGHPSVAIGVTTKDGKHVIAETTWRLLYTACMAIEARYGKPV